MSGTLLDGYDLVTLSGKHYRALRSPQHTFPAKFPDGYIWMLYDAPKHPCGLLLGFGRVHAGEATHELLTNISSAFESAEKGSGCVGFGALYLVGADQDRFLAPSFNGDPERALSRANDHTTDPIAKARYHPGDDSETFYYFGDRSAPPPSREGEPES